MSSDRILLDTNVVSAARRPERQTGEFQSFLRSLNVDEAFISAVSIMEIEFGIARQRKKDAAFAIDLERWLNSILALFDGRIIAFDLAVGRRAGALAVAEQRPSADTMIGATAVEYGLTVATRNIAHFAPIGVALLNPWDRIGTTPVPGP